MAEPIEVLVRTFPPGATLRDQYNNHLGRSGEPVLLEWTREQGILQLQISLPGHKSVTRSVSYRELISGVYPEDGPIRLPAENPGVALADILKHKTAEVLGLSLALLVFGAFWSVKLRARRKSTPKRFQKVGSYLLEERIGAGATAEVFRAVSESDSGALPVALKLMQGSSLDGLSRERFEREIRTSLSLKHPNLAQLYDWGQTDEGGLYLVTEYLSGHTLREQLKKNELLDLALVSRVVSAVAEALSYLHSQGVIHRDVKPDNIFLTDDGEVRLIDLGISWRHDAAPLTGLGIALGTPHYMAPEQINGENGPASDQYALAVTAFELLTGNRPFQAAEGLEILQKHLKNPIPKVSMHRDLGPLIDDILAQGMAKNPESRFPNVRSFSDSLCRHLSQGDDENLDTAAVVT